MKFSSSTLEVQLVLSLCVSYPGSHIVRSHELSIFLLQVSQSPAGMPEGVRSGDYISWRRSQLPPTTSPSGLGRASFGSLCATVSSFLMLLAFSLPFSERITCRLRSQIRFSSWRPHRPQYPVVYHNLHRS